jgi:hypothetical protein
MGPLIFSYVLCGECGPVACDAGRQRACNRATHVACRRPLQSLFFSDESVFYIDDRLALLPIDQLT